MTTTFKVKEDWVFIRGQAATKSAAGLEIVKTKTNSESVKEATILNSDGTEETVLYLHNFEAYPVKIDNEELIAIPVKNIVATIVRSDTTQANS